MNDLVIADPKKCIGCRTCEVACVLAHSQDGLVENLTTSNFFSRLKVTKTAKVTTPIQCHQCEDAPCVKACQAKALVQEDHSVQVIGGACIGCKACLLACPYGAIELAGSASGMEIIKCDLCRQHEGGPACIKVCPTKALYEISGVKMVAQLQNRRKRAALGTINL